MSDPDGMETARKLRQQGCKGCLIFITVLEEMVFQSFEVQAFDYLVKPLKYDQFKRTMTRLLVHLKENLSAGLLIKQGNEHSIIPFSDIVYCEVINRKVFLHLRNKVVLNYYQNTKSGKEIESMLLPVP